MPQLSSINQAYAMVNQDESQRMVAGSSRIMSDMVPTAMFTSKSGPSSHKHRRPYNPNAFCDFCNIKGHMRTNCNKLLNVISVTKLIGYPADYKGKRDTIVAKNSTYHAGHSLYHDQMQMQFPYIPPSQHNESQQHVPMPLFTPLQHQKLLKMLDQTKLDGISGTANMKDSTSSVTCQDNECISSSQNCENCEIDSPDNSISYDTPSSPVRKSSRSSRPRVWHKNYAIKVGSKKCNYSIASVLDYTGLSPTYHNDLLITGSDSNMIHETKTALHHAFKIKDLGELSETEILIHQRKYTLELLADMGLSGAKPVSTPMELNLKLTSTEYDDHINSTYVDTLLEDPTMSKSIYACTKSFTYELSTQIGQIFEDRTKFGNSNVFCNTDWCSCINSKKSITDT
uniref:Reverse transcriptase Ty1/copia-type domain-containing protein n=1 Tax=Solanum lycopersicum TaxID=4081 RepID=A0A3Q7EYZ3_SOLLC